MDHGRLVLVHGFTQTAASWEPVLEALRATLPGLEASAVDLPGHGAGAGVSDSDSDSASALTGGLAGSAARLGAIGGTACYAGYSMGARVCLRLAIDRPDLVESLVLVGATPGIADDAEREARRRSDEQLADRIERIGTEAFVDEWLAGPLFAHLTPAQAGRRARLASTPAGLADALRGLGTGAGEPMWDELAGLPMPVLLVAGATDEKFARIAEAMREAIGAGATVELVAGAGHPAPFERPGAFAAILARWLART